MDRRLAIGLVVAVLAAGIAVFALRMGAHDATRAPVADAGSSVRTDVLVEEFRAVERAALRRYNAALADQRANRIDEVELSNIIEREVLEPWRTIRASVHAAEVPTIRTELYATLKRYLEARQLAWEAYVAGLRSADDAAARTHYDAHHLRSSEADTEARQLGRLFRELGL